MRCSFGNIECQRCDRLILVVRESSVAILKMNIKVNARQKPDPVLDNIFLTRNPAGIKIWNDIEVESSLRAYAAH
jgi:hypothetical protein